MIPNPRSRDFDQQPGFDLNRVFEAEQSLPQEVRKFQEYANKDMSFYKGNPMIPRRRTFSQAVNGIERADYEGLEMLDFGSLSDGTPAASFLDEDNQRQVIRLTVPQWFAGVESRSKARMEMQQMFEKEARKKAFKPYFDAVMKRGAVGEDAEITQALQVMYDQDPAMALDIAGSFLRTQQKGMAAQEEMPMWRGKPVTKPFFQQALALEEKQYQDRSASFDRLSESMRERPYSAAMIENAKALQRTPQNFMAPSNATLLDHVRSNQMGPLPLVNLITAMGTPGMVPILPGAAQIPKPNERGEYEPGQLTRFLSDFNNVSMYLGWGPVVGTDEAGLSQLIDALNMANNTKGAYGNIEAIPQQIQPLGIRQQTLRNESQERQAAMRYGGKQPQEQAAPNVQSRDDELMSAIQASGIQAKDMGEAFAQVKKYADAIRYRMETGQGMREFPLDEQQQQAVLRAYELMVEIAKEGQE
jgi:hypothetical protein